MLEIGSIIDEKYKVLSVIGHGGMSTVYLAINEKANKPWAIKEVRKDGIKHFDVVKQSLIVEIDMLKKLSHKGLPSIVDVIDKDDNFLIVMDYIEGNTLKSVLKEKSVIQQEMVVDWALQLCDVLKCLHNRKPPIIYRDMKPSNIMLRSDGSVVLIDFGTAREFKEENVEDTTCLGTQGYAAPEQFGGQGQTDVRTDIYSLGATIYHLVTGHNPSEPPYEMYPITRWNDTLSTGLEHIILKCTQRNPQDRYQNVDELIYALKHYRDLDISALAKYRRRVGLFMATAITGIGLMATSVVMNVQADRQQINEYEYLIDVASKAPTFEDTMLYYQKAIDTDNTRQEAFKGIVEAFRQDSVFTVNEEEILVKLNISVDKHLTKFAQGNPDGYADFCYDIGSLYWFYYENEESRQLNAVKWFQAAMDFYEDKEDKSIEYKRSQLYVEIGSFYKEIIMAQIEGSDKGMYSKYWNNLLELKKYNDENPDRDMVRLRLYREIATRTTEYARYFLEEGIALEDIEKMFESIREDMKSIEEQANSNMSKEIKEIYILLTNAEKMLQTVTIKTQ